MIQRAPCIWGWQFTVRVERSSLGGEHVTCRWAVSFCKATSTLWPGPRRAFVMRRCAPAAIFAQLSSAPGSAMSAR
eukprot:584173-Pyramimonas_sp.AAC.1